jgi:hypothetical protein
MKVYKRSPCCRAKFGGVGDYAWCDKCGACFNPFIRARRKTKGGER